ncbi:DUF4249 family protein [bacterium]|nr:DUF4249 family protein [bacterium]
MRKLSCISLVLFLIASCSDAPSFLKKDNLISVQCILDVKYKTQVFVNRAINIDDLDGVYILDSLKTRVSGANVIIESNSKKVILTERRPGLYEDVNSELEISDGQKYDLMVDVEGEQVSAETIVPKAPHLISPIDIDNIVVFLEVDTDYVNGISFAYQYITNSPIQFKWEATHGASYNFGIYDLSSTVYYPDSTTYNYPYVQIPHGSVLEDKLQIFGNNAIRGENWAWYAIPLAIGVSETKQARIQIIAYDEASTMYFNSHQHNLERTSNVVGGLGCFGSINRFSKDITVTTHSKYAEW